jgi:hypothetical protein
MSSAVLDRISRAAADPVQAGYYIWSRIHADSLFQRYRSGARNAGLRHLYLIVSFDCDTAEDIRAAEEVARRMGEYGIPACFAVPGELLAEGAETYRRLAAAGAEFLNHGYRSHTYFDTAVAAYRSCFFYDEEPPYIVKNDIMTGDHAVRTILGLVPQGFRAPHFGTFQKRNQLRFLHSILRELGYEFSSSTSPFFAFRHGPVFEEFGIKEIPISGGRDRALTIIDSWGCFAAPSRELDGGDYVSETVGLARMLAGGPGLLNFYADPSHVVGEKLFFSAMAELARLAHPVNFSTLMKEIR